MFSDDTSDFMVGLVHFLIGAAILVPIIILYVIMKDQGLDVEKNITVLISSIALMIGFFGFGILFLESVLDNEKLYYIIAIASFVLWLLGTILIMNVLVAGSGNSYLDNYQFANATEKWYATLGLIALCVSGFSIVNSFLRCFEWIHNGIENLIVLAIFVILSVLIIIFMMTGLFGVVEIIVFISIIPFIVTLISMIVQHFRNN